MMTDKDKKSTQTDPVSLFIKDLDEGEIGSYKAVVSAIDKESSMDSENKNTVKQIIRKSYIVGAIEVLSRLNEYIKDE